MYIYNLEQADYVCSRFNPPDIMLTVIKNYFTDDVEIITLENHSLSFELLPEKKLYQIEEENIRYIAAQFLYHTTPESIIDCGKPDHVFQMAVKPYFDPWNLTNQDLATFALSRFNQWKEIPE